MRFREGLSRARLCSRRRHSASSGVAYAQGPTVTVGADGKTAPVFNYAEATRERVWIPVAGLDTDSDGVTDRVAIDIVRPKESGPAVKVPAIIDPSPYYTSSGRGNETQRIITGAVGHARPLPAVLRQLLRPARLRVHRRARRRHRVLDRLRGPRWLKRHRGLQGRHRLAQRPRRGLQRADRRRERGRQLAQRQVGHDRQVLRRHVRQRHRRDRRRGPDHDRPDQRHLRLVQLLAHRRRPQQHQLPERALELDRRCPERRRRAAAAPDQLGRPGGHRQALCAPTRTLQDQQDGDEHGDINEFWRDRDHNKDASRSRLRCSSSTASRTTTSAWTTPACGGTR